jgi:site-specific DNA-methyltransferase (adenine-specific)
MRASEVRLVKGRLKFGDGKNSAPFPSAVVVFRPGARDERRAPSLSACRFSRSRPEA